MRRYEYANCDWKAHRPTLWEEEKGHKDLERIREVGLYHIKNDTLRKCHSLSQETTNSDSFGGKVRHQKNPPQQ